jgi:hypothetical protein
MVTQQRLFLFFLTALLLITPTIISQQEDIRFYHERETNLTIFEKCRIDGAICASDFGCNLTMLYPNQTLVIDSVPMLRGVTYFNFSINATQQEINGVYENTVDCGNESSFGSNTFFHQVTPNGSIPFDTAQGLIIVISMVIIIMVSCFSGFLGIKIRNPVVSISLISFAVLLLIFALGMTLNIMELSLGTFSGITSNYSSLYILFTVLITIGGFSLVVYLVKIALELYWDSRGIIDKNMDNF